MSIDANWDFYIEQKNPAFFEQIKVYLQDGVAFWKKEGMHHPFLLPEYRRGDGWRFHRNFAKLGLDTSYADDISFIELLDVPTYGMSTTKENRAVFKSLINAMHLDRLSRIIFDGRPKLVFIPKTTYRFLKDWNDVQRWFPFGLQPESVNGERFINLHNEKDQFVFVCNHFSASNTNSFYKQMSTMIRSFVEPTHPKCWWKISYASSWNGERVEENRYIHAKDVREVKGILLSHFNQYRVERDFFQFDFEIVQEVEIDHNYILDLQE